MSSPMKMTAQLGVEFWNDSCGLKELKEAVEAGAVGATSNPVIVSGAYEADKEHWQPVLKSIIKENPIATEDDIAWLLIEEVMRQGAQILRPVFDKSEGKLGLLSAQVNAKYFRNARLMVEHGKRLHSVAPNTAIKAPLTEAGIEAVEELTAAGIPVNATVSFTLSQAIACAEAMERGLKRSNKQVQPYVTLMVGRLDDHLKRVMDKEKVTCDPGHLNWAGIAVFKRANQIFKERGYKAKLLSAAYRHQMHWSELVGPGIVQTIPYGWWKQFNNSGITPSLTLNNPVDTKIIDTLNRFGEFRKAYEENGLKKEEFVSYGPTVNTLEQFCTSYHGLLDKVRAQILT